MSQNDHLVPDLVRSLVADFRATKRGSPSYESFLHRLEVIYNFVGDVLKGAKSPAVKK